MSLMTAFILPSCYRRRHYKNLLQCRRYCTVYMVLQVSRGLTRHIEKYFRAIYSITCCSESSCLFFLFPRICYFMKIWLKELIFGIIFIIHIYLKYFKSKLLYIIIIFLFPSIGFEFHCYFKKEKIIKCTMYIYGSTYVAAKLN